MAKITIEELSYSLKDYLNGLGLTEAQVQGLIDKFEAEKIGDINDLETTNKTIVGAINEVKNSIGNQDLSAYQTVEDNDLLTTNKTIVEAINEVFQSGNSAKQELVAALVAKGLQATTDMSFNELISNINNGLVLPSGNAVAANVLSGKTFINNTGSVITGTMTNNGSKTITPSISNQSFGAGYYSSVKVSGDSDLIASNIKSGVTIFGIKGTAGTANVRTSQDEGHMLYEGDFSWHSTYKAYNSTDKREVLYNWTSSYIGNVYVNLSGQWARNYTSNSGQIVIELYVDDEEYDSLYINGGYTTTSNGGISFPYYYNKWVSVPVEGGTKITAKLYATMSGTEVMVEASIYGEIY